MPEEVQAMIDYSGAIGAFLSASEKHFHDKVPNDGNMPDTSLIKPEEGK